MVLNKIATLYCRPHFQKVWDLLHNHRPVARGHDRCAGRRILVNKGHRRPLAAGGHLAAEVVIRRYRAARGVLFVVLVNVQRRHSALGLLYPVAVAVVYECRPAADRGKLYS
jgi:hypothetical protein